MTGEELRALRGAADISARELSAQIAISPTTLSRYENGNAPIPRKVELAARYVCEPSVAPQSAEARLVEAIKEVARW